MLTINPFNDDLFTDPTKTPGQLPADLAQLLDQVAPADLAQLLDQVAPAALAQVAPDGPTLLTDMDITASPTLPALLRLDNADTHLLYPGKINLLFAAPAAGKTHLAFHLIHQQALAAQTTLFIDYEKNAATYAERATDHAIPRGFHRHLAYWRPNRPIGEIRDGLLQWARTHDVSTIVIDGVGQALSAAGIDESDNSAVASWFRDDLEPLAHAGFTILLIDHSGHSNPIPGRTAHPVGASAKLRYVTGSLLQMSVVKPFSKHTAGYAVLIPLKDNSGWLPIGQPIAEFHVRPSTAGTTFSLTSCASRDDLADAVLDYVRKHTADHGYGPSKNKVRSTLGHSDAERDAAIKKLVDDKRITITKDGIAHRLTVPATAPGEPRVA